MLSSQPVVGLLARDSSSERETAPFQNVLFWSLAAFALSLAYPGRQVSDLVWVLVPLWILAAVELQLYLPDKGNHLVSILQAGLILILAALFWTTLVSTGMLTAGGELIPTGVRLALLAGIVALGVLITILIALGWSQETSRLGAVWGLTAAASVYLISMLWSASQLNSNQPDELWSPSPGTGQASLFLGTLKDISNWNTGFSNQIEILSTFDSSSLRWALRDYPNTRFVTSLPKDQMPPLIVTAETDAAPALAEAYRGQDFVWRSYPGWSGLLPDELVSWLTFRKAALRNEKLILWVRSDQFPGEALSTDSLAP